MGQEPAKERASHPCYICQRRKHLLKKKFVCARMQSDDLTFLDLAGASNCLKSASSALGGAQRPYGQLQHGEVHRCIPTYIGRNPAKRVWDAQSCAELMAIVLVQRKRGWTCVGFPALSCHHRCCCLPPGNIAQHPPRIGQQPAGLPSRPSAPRMIQR